MPSPGLVVMETPTELIRTAHDLRDLIGQKQVDALARQGFSLYDSSYRLIAPSSTRNLNCPVAAHHNRAECSACPVLRQEGKFDRWVLCAPDANVFIVGLYLQGKFAGLLGNAPVSDSEKSANQFHIASKVRQRADALSLRLTQRRTGRILERAKAAIRQAATPQEIRNVLSTAAGDLFNRVSRILFAVPRGEFIDVDQRTGEPMLKRTIGRTEGHVGYTIRERKLRYEPDLKADDPYFSRDASEHTLPGTVLTVPLVWGWDERQAALQIQSADRDAFPETDRYEWERLARWAGRQAVTLAMRQELRRARLHEEVSEGWRASVTDLLLVRDDDISAVLRSKREIFRRFAEELKLVSGSHCIASSIRVLNPLTKHLSYAVCIGDQWTKEALETLYRTNTASAGVAALNQPAALYSPKVDEAKNYYQVLEGTRSLWAKRFLVRGAPRGVVSIDWDITDACSSDTESRLEALLSQFEAVLNMIAAQEEVLFRELERNLRLNDAEKLSQLVRKLADVFNAQDCSLFLDKEGSRFLMLKAGTYPAHIARPGEISYQFGIGITGWVAENRVTVSVHNPHDRNELDSLSRRHCILKPISHTRLYPTIHPEATDYLDLMAAPIVARGRVIGVIRLDSVKSQELFRHEDEVFLQEIADELARNLDRIWIEEEASGQVRQLEEEANLNRAWLTAREKAANFRDAVRVDLMDAAVATEADGAFIRIDDSLTDAHYLETFGLMKSLEGDRYEFQHAGSTAFSANVWEADDWLGIRETLRQKLGPETGELLQSGALLRMDLDPHASATLGLCFRILPDPRKFSQDKAFMLAKRVSAELKPALMLDRAQRRLSEELETATRLRDFGLAFAVAADTSAVARKAIEFACSRTKMEFGTIRLLDPRSGKWILVGTSKTIEGILPLEIETNSRLEQCRRSESPVWLDLCPGDPRMIDCASLPPGPRRAYLESLRNWIGVPLRLNNVFLGVIILASTTAFRVRHEALIDVDIIAPYAAAAIVSLQSVEKKLELAEPFAMIGTMLSGFLHTMRNKMTAANGFLDNLQNMKDLPPPVTERLNKLHDAFEIIRSICQDLVSFAATDGPACLEAVRLNDSLDRAWLDLPEPMREGVEIDRRYAEPQPTILGNPAQMETLIAMLIQNSLEALPPEGSRRIRLETARRGRNIILRVADSGCGMDRDTRQRALQPFFTTKHSGNGLGLAVVAGIARRHKARVRISSRPNRGTCVTLSFPLEAAIG